MIGICFLAAQVIVFLLFYPMLVMGKRADEELRVLSERKFQADNQEEMENNMESQVLRTIEREISKGSAPVRFSGMGFAEDTYHLVESQAKLNQLLDYFFRIGEYAALADKQV